MKMLKQKIIDLIRYYFLDLPLWAKITAVLLSGTLCGMILFLIHISNFFSYVSDNPKTCINCHIMVPQYVTWFHSSHREVATCNDCHVPQDNIFLTYSFKAMDGMRHSTIFTLRGEDQAITIKNAGLKAVQSNCIRCHKTLFETQPNLSSATRFNHYKTERRCWECHKDVPHGGVRSLSSAPFGRAPTTKSMIPEWLKKIIKNEELNKERKDVKK